MQLGKAVLWTRDQQNAAKSHIQWAPEYRLTASVRGPAEPGKEPTSGENHSDNTQIYLITGGSGTVLVEGKVDPANDYLVAPGEHRGGPIVGGRQVKVKVGDLLSLPPDTWHIAWGDPGVPLQYLIIQVHTRQTAP
jgi:mannose-6-phosphate isomerase-like protein (cupin superfamily)